MSATERLSHAFTWQSDSCRALGSPFMGRLMALCAERWPEQGAVALKARNWPGDLGPKSASLPLRIAGGLHALVLTGQSPSLAAVYPPHSATDDALWAQVNTALEEHKSFLLNWIDSAPQTNEVRRSAALIPVAHMLAARFDMPLRLSELGASGGLNLNFDRFSLRAGDTHYGNDSDVALAPDWTGQAPAPSALRIAERRGVDLNPLNANAPDDALRLMAYLWPDQADRLARTRAAIALPQAEVDRADAIEWLSTRVSATAGHIHLIYSTIAWQYFPEAAQDKGRALIETAGRHATEAAPLAWLTMEADVGDRGAALTLRLWPGDLMLPLARVDFHGRWLDWIGPVTLKS
ncbi:DUF2332 domain-containing protein [Roseobacteraceae bacterium S113]